MLARLVATARSARRFGTTPPAPGHLTKEAILALPSTPLSSPSYPRGPYTFFNREYFILQFESDPIAIRKRVPEPLVPAAGNVVLYEWINMPDSTGFGSYTESGIVIPCTYNGEPVNFTQSMYLDCEPPIAGGREVWGFPKKYAKPVFGVKNDTVYGRLEYNGEEVAVGTMVYKHQTIPEVDALKALSKTCVNLKIIPDVDYAPKIAQLVAYNLTNIKFKGAWSGPARLQLSEHINAPVADFPIRRMLGGKHFLADITLPYGRVLYDYLKAPAVSAIDKAAALAKTAAPAPSLTKLPAAQSTTTAAPSSSSSPSSSRTHVATVPTDEAERTRQGYLTRARVLASPCMPLSAPSFAMPLSQPPELRNIQHVDREYFIIKYSTTADAVRACLPDMLHPSEDNAVLLMFVHTTGGGIGDYTKVDMCIPCVDQRGRHFHYGVQAYCDASASITLGREVFGFPYKHGGPSLTVASDTLTGALEYGGVPVCRGTMGFKTAPLDAFEAQQMLSVPYLGLKLIPDVDGQPAIAQLVRSDRTHIKIKSAFCGKARLDLRAHVGAPLADLPVKGVTAAYHIKCDLVQPIGVVEHDYMAADA